MPKTISCTLNADSLDTADWNWIKKNKTSAKQPKSLCVKGLYRPGTSCADVYAEPCDVPRVWELFIVRSAVLACKTGW